MQSAEKRLVDALYDELIDALPEDWDTPNIKSALAKACRESCTKIVEDGRANEQTEYTWQWRQGWEYPTAGKHIDIVPADRA